MSKLTFFDFICRSCGHQFEELVQPSRKTHKCPECLGIASRQISLGHLDYRMGYNNDFPSAARRMEKMQRHKARTDKGGISDGAPNLKMY